MEPTMSSQLSRRILAAVAGPSSHPLGRSVTLRHARLHNQARRNASSKSSKPIILEQPDKFRPPSHPARLNTRGTTGSYGSAGTYQGGYNQGVSEREREEQGKKRYPHMFPNEGSFMHWFLTNKKVHLWISLGILSSLATFTLTQSFLQTSPFAHLIPPLSSLPWHPLTYIREVFAVVRLHIDYTSEQTAEKRRQNILDAQKRRLYRRAHGMENMDVEEDNGIDVKGLVSWDDGLTNVQRAKLEKKRAESVIAGGGDAEREAAAMEAGVAIEGVGDMTEEAPRKRRVKRWLGIWE